MDAKTRYEDGGCVSAANVHNQVGDCATENAGKTPKEKKEKLNINSGKSDPRSLFHTDDEDYVAPEVEDEIARRLSAKDGVSSETSDGAITVAPIKDESDKPSGKSAKSGKNEKKDIK